MARIDLQRVAKARRRIEAAQEELVAAILAAAASHETYADIARMARLSKARIGQIVSENRRSREPDEPQ